MISIKYPIPVEYLVGQARSIKKGDNISSAKRPCYSIEDKSGPRKQTVLSRGSRDNRRLSIKDKIVKTSFLGHCLAIGPGADAFKGIVDCTRKSRTGTAE